MTTTRTTMLAFGAALIASASACDANLTGINRNPNAPTDVPAEFLFPQAVTASVGLVRGAGFDLHLTGLWVQHIAKIQYTDEDRYNIRPQDVEGYWTAFYAGSMQDFTRAIDKAEEQDRPNQVAPAMIMRAWTFGHVTDIWGDVPFSQANRGDQGTLTPVYDRQEAVYDALIADLRDASTMFVAGGTGYGASDPIYGGDTEKWQKFANSLRLRYAMRLSDANATKAATEVAAAVAAGVFTSNADNAVLQWPGDGSNDHPFYTNFRSRDDHRVSATLVDTLLALSDPRLAVYAQVPADGGQYKGVPNGLSNEDAIALGLTKTSKIGTYFSQANSPSVLMHYAEVAFLLAEAAERGWITGSAATWYMEGIRASMEMYGLSATTYLLHPRVVYQGGAAGLRQIALQKWIALYGQASEAYAEWRRTGVPTLTAGPAAIVPQVPRRLTYPLSEQSFNLANLEAATSAQGGNTLATRVWWDR